MTQAAKEREKGRRTEIIMFTIKWRGCLVFPKAFLWSVYMSAAKSSPNAMSLWRESKRVWRMFSFKVHCHAASRTVRACVVAAGKRYNRSYDLEWNLVIENGPDAATTHASSYSLTDEANSGSIFSAVQNVPSLTLVIYSTHCG